MGVVAASGKKEWEEAAVHESGDFLDKFSESARQKYFPFVLAVRAKFLFVCAGVSYKPRTVQNK